MKASWIETQKIEEYVHSLDQAEGHAMHAEVLCNTVLYEKVYWQKVAYTYVHAYAREALKLEIAQAQKTVFERPYYEKFRQAIQNIFS